LLDLGEEMDGSAVHLYIEHVIEVSRQYVLSGEGGSNARESAERKFAIKCLWRVVGRSGEVACFTWDALKWDIHFKSMFIEVLYLINFLRQYT